MRPVSFQSSLEFWLKYFYLKNFFFKWFTIVKADFANQFFQTCRVISIIHFFHNGNLGINSKKKIWQLRELILFVSCSLNLNFATLKYKNNNMNYLIFLTSLFAKRKTKKSAIRFHAERIHLSFPWVISISITRDSVPPLVLTFFMTLTFTTSASKSL